MKLPQSFASVCASFWNWLISPSLLFIAVMVSFPAFLFQQNLLVLVIEATTFFVLALTRRGKLRLLPSLFMIIGIVFFALFSPHGEVVTRLGNFTITKGALEAGLGRGVSLAGMVFLSQLALSPNLSLPGGAGKFVVDMFTVLDKLASEQITFRDSSKKLKNFFTLLDNRLYQVYWNGEEEKNEESFDKDRNSDGQNSSINERKKDEKRDFRDEKEKELNKKSLSFRGIITAILFPCVLYFLLWKSV